MSNLKRTLWRSQLNGVEDITSRLKAVIDTGRSKIKLPEGNFLVTKTIVLHTHQQLIGAGMGRRDGSHGTCINAVLDPETDPVAIQIGSSEERAENCRIKGFRLQGAGRNEDPEIDVLRGIQLGLPTEPYAANNFGQTDVVIEGFDVGFDNYESDESFIRGGFIEACNINGRTGQNGVNEITSCGCGDAAKWGWQVKSGGIDVRCGIYGGNAIDFRVETGASLCAQSTWHDGISGDVACVHMANNAVAVFIHVKRVWAEIQPLFVKGEGGCLDFFGCHGGTNFAFDVMSNMVVTGQGELGTKNGSPYTASSF